MKISGKTAVVTGGASGIGKATAEALAEAGAHVIIGDLDAANGEAVAASIRARGQGADYLRLDVADLASVAEFKAGALALRPQVDIVANVAGWGKIQPFMENTPEFWRKVIDINYVGVLNCTKTALDLMVKQNGGAIVSISSDASRQGEPREAVYGGVKAAVNSFMKTIAKENGRYGIRCNVVCPGVTIPATTDEVGGNSMWSKADSMFTPEQFDKIAKSLPLRKVGRPQDIANAVAFLASSKAGHVTGQVLSVSGGYSMIG